MTTALASPSDGPTPDAPRCPTCHGRTRFLARAGTTCRTLAKCARCWRVCCLDPASGRWRMNAALTFGRGIAPPAVPDPGEAA